MPLCVKKGLELIQQYSKGISIKYKTMQKNMQNIRRLNYFCKDGENRKNWFILTLRFGGGHHHQACCSLIVLKRRVMNILVSNYQYKGICMVYGISMDNT
jgi:hypothetical protein